MRFGEYTLICVIGTSKTGAVRPDDIYQEWVVETRARAWTEKPLDTSRRVFDEMIDRLIRRNMLAHTIDGKLVKTTHYGRQSAQYFTKDKAFQWDRVPENVRRGVRPQSPVWTR